MMSKTMPSDPESVRSLLAQVANAPLARTRPGLLTASTRTMLLAVVVTLILVAYATGSWVSRSRMEGFLGYQAQAESVQLSEVVLDPARYAGAVLEVQGLVTEAAALDEGVGLVLQPTSGTPASDRSHYRLLVRFDGASGVRKGDVVDVYGVLSQPSLGRVQGEIPVLQARYVRQASGD